MSALQPAGEWLTSTGAPHLYVRVEVSEPELEAGTGAADRVTAGFSAAVQVREKVSLERAPGLKVMAPVWGSQQVGQADRAELQERIRASVSSLLEEFAEACERANAA